MHVQKDEGNDMQLKVQIVDAPKEVAIWPLIGVDHDSWWNEYAPGIDCAREFAPGPEYDPNKQLNILCTGRQVDDALCDYLADVLRNRQQDSKNSAVFVGAGVVGGISWIDRKWSRSAKRSNSAVTTHGGRSSKELPLLQRSQETQVIFEVPPEAQIADTKQYRLLSNKELLET